MAYTPIDKSDDYFNTVLYTGDGTSSKAITGVGFQPDWVWLKARNHAYSHQLFDVVRGATKLLTSEATDAEQTLSGVTSFDSDGFTVGPDAGSNGSAKTFASWNWLAANGTSSNEDGSITSTVSANTTSGFSIVSFTGNKTSGATIGHGLGTEVDCIAIKNRADAAQWSFYHRSLGGTKYMAFNSDASAGTASTQWNDTDPDSSVFTVGSSNNTNDTSDGMIAYCFAEKQGFSKFGKYEGNGDSNGIFVYTGFKPAMMIIKKTNGTQEWGIYDNKRDPFNVADHRLFPNLNSSESTSTDMLDFTSNGFKCRTSNDMVNASSGDYIYMAFAENPFVTSTGIPGLAR